MSGVSPGSAAWRPTTRTTSAPSRRSSAATPPSRSAWASAIARTQAHARRRDEIAAIVTAQQRRRGAPPAAIEAAQRLADKRTVAIVTGQQAGLFGGPLFTLLKALTALKLAEQVSRDHNVPAVAVFWIDAEDHDWDEVRSCTVFDDQLEPRVGRPAGRARRRTGPGCADSPRRRRLVTSSTSSDACCRRPNSRPALLEQLRDAYAPGVGMADAFGRWLERMLGDRGLVVYDASDPASKPLVARGLRARAVDAGPDGEACRSSPERI